MTNQPRQQLIIWWVLWSAFMVGIGIIYFFLNPTAGAPNPNASPTSWLAATVPVVISVIIRCLVLPRAEDALTALPLFIVGIAMAESACFLGLFIFPEHKLELFVISVLGSFSSFHFSPGRYFDNI